MNLDRFYLIVDSVQWIERLVPLGVRLVQLRVKDRPFDELRQQVSAAKAICDATGVQMIVNDYWELALELGCGFVHLGQGDLDSADVPALRRAGIKLGISTHSHAELQRALSFDPDYVALGPIYSTRLKQMPWAPQGLERITEWKQSIGGKPLVAIGGLTCERLPGVFSAGADIAAVITDVLQHSDPEGRTRQWLAATRGNERSL